MVVGGCVALSVTNTFLSSEKYWTKFEQFLGWLSVNNTIVWLYNKSSGNLQCNEGMRGS
jgi:hypothetical protein